VLVVGAVCCVCGDQKYYCVFCHTYKHTTASIYEEEDNNILINNNNNCWSPAISEEIECYNSEDEDCYSNCSESTAYNNTDYNPSSSPHSTCHLISVNPMMDSTVMYDTVDQVKKLSGVGQGSVLVNGGNALKLAALKQHQQQQLLHYAAAGQPQQNQHCAGGGGNGI
jgi:hypothetical protein